MSQLPDGYRVQDGCWNCESAVPMRYNPFRCGYAPNVDGPTHDEDVDDYGICPQHKRKEPT